MSRPRDPPPPPAPTKGGGSAPPLSPIPRSCRLLWPVSRASQSPPREAASPRVSATRALSVSKWPERLHGNPCLERVVNRMIADHPGQLSARFFSVDDLSQAIEMSRTDCYLYFHGIPFISLSAATRWRQISRSASGRS